MMLPSLVSALVLVAAANPPVTPSTATPGPTPAADAASKRARLVLLDLQANGVDEATVKTLTDVIGTRFSSHRQFDVVSAGDLRAMMNVEAARQTCDMGDSCMAEIAAALGADLVVHGSVGKLGELIIVNLSLFDAGKGSAVAREKVQSGSAADLSALLDGAVDRLAGDARPSSGGLNVGLLVGGIAVGAAGVIAAAVGGTLAAQSFSTIEDPSSVRNAKDDALGGYPILLGVAVAGAVVAVAGIGMTAAAVLE